MNRLVVGKDTVWYKGMTIEDLLKEIKENRSLVGVLINGIYNSRSQFNKTKIPNNATIEFIPWREKMTLRELLEYQTDSHFFCAAIINGFLIPEDQFDKTVIPKDAEVGLLTYIGGG